MLVSHQGILDQFEMLTLGPSAPGQQQDPTQDPAYYPRPTGEEAAAARAAPPPFHPGNCSPRFMRLTVNAIPSQQVGAPESAARAAWLCLIGRCGLSL
jgi:hypothetical protein